jgi:hypothetical protein
MPRFATPDPISVTIELGIGEIQIAAGERVDTLVDVRPSDPTKPGDVRAAEQTRVEYANGRLQITAPKGWRQHTLRGGADSIEVEIALPTGSQVRADAGISTLRCTGRLGECRLKSGLGDIQLQQAGPLRIKVGRGDITVAQVDEHAELVAASGEIRVGTIDGTAIVKNSNGETWIGEITGDLRVSAANGAIVVERAGAGVAAKTATGDIQLGEVRNGAVVAETGYGALDVGIREGVPAWLELSTALGTVENQLKAADRPEPGEATVEVLARTALGDIIVRRSRSPVADAAHRD